MSSVMSNTGLETSRFGSGKAVVVLIGLASLSSTPAAR